VGVSGLPRDSLVEVEVVGRYDQGNQQNNTQSNTLRPSQYVVSELKDWPQTVEQDLEIDGVCFQSQVIATNVPTMLSLGTIVVCAKCSLKYNGESTVFDVQAITDCLVSELCTSLNTAGLLSPDYLSLRTLRVYYMPPTGVLGLCQQGCSRLCVNREELCVALSLSISKQLGISKFPLILVPVQSLDVSVEYTELGKPNLPDKTILSASYVACDPAFWALAP
jgi:hypothetical protein